MPTFTIPTKRLRRISIRKIISTILLALVIFTLPNGYLLWSFKSHYQSTLPEGYSTAMVLGAGIVNNSRPSLVLQERLDTALALYRQNKIKTILVSGSNPDSNYNEPAVMKKYLLSQGVNDEHIALDFGGRRTIDSCWRAKNVFKLEKVVVITQYFHQPRTTYLCKSIGLDTYPVIARDSSTNVTLTGFIREFPSAWQALWNTHSDYKPTIGENGNEERLE